MFLPLILSTILAPYLERYERPFTLLEMDTHYALEEAERYPNSVFVLCDENSSLSNVITLRKLQPHQLRHLSSCEHFDIIVARDVESQLLSFLQKMAHLLLVETPSGFDEYLSEQGSLERTSYIHPIKESRRWEIRATFKEKFLTRKDRKPPYAMIESKWIPGINLITFLMLGDRFPTREQIASQIHFLPGHSDFALNNFVLQGAQLNPIDCNDHHQSYSSNPELIYLFKKLIQETNPNDFLKKINLLYRYDPPFLKDYSQG